jgi:hypothetical protein
VVGPKYIHKDFVEDFESQGKADKAGTPIQESPVTVKNLIRREVEERKEDDHDGDLRKQIRNKDWEFLMQPLAPQRIQDGALQERLRRPQNVRN